MVTMSMYEHIFLSTNTIVYPDVPKPYGYNLSLSHLLKSAGGGTISLARTANAPAKLLESRCQYQCFSSRVAKTFECRTSSQYQGIAYDLHNPHATDQYPLQQTAERMRPPCSISRLLARMQVSRQFHVECLLYKDTYDELHVAAYRTRRHSCRRILVQRNSSSQAVFILSHGLQVPI